MLNEVVRRKFGGEPIIVDTVEVDVARQGVEWKGEVFVYELRDSDVAGRVFGWIEMKDSAVRYATVPADAVSESPQAAVESAIDRDVEVARQALFRAADGFRDAAFAKGHPSSVLPTGVKGWTVPVSRGEVFVDILIPELKGEVLLIDSGHRAIATLTYGRLLGEGVEPAATAEAINLAAFAL